MKRFFIHNLLQFMAMTMLPVLIVGGALCAIVSTRMHHMVQTYNEAALSQMVQITELILQGFDTANLLISSDARTYPSLRRALGVVPGVTQEDLNNINTLSSTINSIVALSPYVESIYVLIDGADYYYTSGGGIALLSSAVDAQWLEQLQKSRQQDTQTGLTSRRIYRQFPLDREKSLISIYRRFFSWNGTAVININLDKLQQTLSAQRIYADQFLCITDSQSVLPLAGQLRAADESALLALADGSHRIVLDGMAYLVEKRALDRFGWKLMSVIPAASVFSSVYSIAVLIGAVTLICLALCVGASTVSSRLQQKSIRAILEAFDYAERAAPGADPPKQARNIGDPYSYIINSIVLNGILKRYMQTQLDCHRYRAQALELTALRYQINPHFIVNTLKNIYWKSVEVSGLASPLSLMIENFLDNIHYSLSTTPERVTLGEEIRHTKSYCEILQARHSESWSILWDCPAPLESAACPRFILQPYIENAFTHGIRHSGRPERIRVRIRRYQQSIRIDIFNTGVGIEPEKLARLREMLRSDAFVDQHIGIYNPHRRIQLAYGPQYGVSISSRRTVGTHVVICIPASEDG